MATLTPLAASFRAIPRPMPRELPVISACFPFRDMSTSLSVRSNEKNLEEHFHISPKIFAVDLGRKSVVYQVLLLA